MKRAAWAGLVCFLLGLGVLALSGAARDTRGSCHHGACFAGSLPAGDGKLTLRNFGTKRFWGFTVYDAGLYLPPGTRTKEAALGGGPKGLILRYHRNIPKETIIRAAWHCLKSDPALNLPALQARVDEFHSRLQDVKAHDQYKMVYLPGRGTEFYFNGALVTVIPGEDFQKAYFGIWLSEHPISKKLRNTLLREEGS